MLSKTADVFATSLALIKEENVAYGVYRDYFITFYENKHNKVIDISCFLGDSDDNSIGYLNLSDCIKNNIEKYHITDLMEKVHGRGGRVGCFPVSENSWKDLGEWPEYLKMIKVW